MPRSELGKYLRIGNEVVDPLELADSVNFAQQIANEWLLQRCIISVATELNEIIEALQEETSGRKGLPSLRDYTTDVFFENGEIFVDVVPSPRDEARGLNIFNLLDKGNGREPIQARGTRPMRFRRYQGNLISNPNSSFNNPVTFNSVTVTNSWVSTYEVQPYAGKEISKRVVNGVDIQREKDDLINGLRRGDPRDVNASVNSDFRELFGRQWQSQVRGGRRVVGYALLRLTGNNFIQAAECRIREEDRE